MRKSIFFSMFILLLCSFVVNGQGLHEKERVVCTSFKGNVKEIIVVKSGKRCASNVTIDSFIVIDEIKYIFNDKNKLKTTIQLDYKYKSSPVSIIETQYLENGIKEKETVLFSEGNSGHGKYEKYFNKEGNYLSHAIFNMEGEVMHKDVYEYNSYGDLLSITDKNGQIWSKGILNAEGRVVEQYDINTYRKKAYAVNYLEYDSSGRLAKKKRINLAFGDSVIPPIYEYYKYMDNGVVERTGIRYWGMGKDRELITIVQQFNKDFRPIKGCTKRKNKDGENCTWYEYHKNGQIKKKTFTNYIGEGTIVEYDEEGDLLSYFAFDKKKNNTTNETLKTFPRLIPPEIKYEYDIQGNWIKKIVKGKTQCFYYEREITYFED